jgi:hypothetical protein
VKRLLKPGSYFDDDCAIDKGELKMNRYLGDWMEDEYIVPTNEEVADLYLAVEATPYEFDYSCDDVLDKAEKRGLCRLFIQLVILGERGQRAELAE